MLATSWQSSYSCGGLKGAALANEIQGERSQLGLRAGWQPGLRRPQGGAALYPVLPLPPRVGAVSLAMVLQDPVTLTVELHGALLVPAGHMAATRGRSRAARVGRRGSTAVPASQILSATTADHRQRRPAPVLSERWDAPG